MRADESEELNAFESRLAAWRPASAGLDADRLLFAAGRASVRGRFAWPTAAVSLALVSLGLGQQLLSSRAKHWSDHLAMQSRIDVLSQALSHPLTTLPLTNSGDSFVAEKATYRAGDTTLNEHVPPVTATSLVEGPDSKPLHIWQLDQALEQ